MNILLISPYIPYPLSSGGAQAVFNMIDNLRGIHHYTMVVNEGGQNTRENKQSLQKLWPNVDIILYPFSKQLLSPTFVYEKTRRVLLRKFMPQSRLFQMETTLRPYGEWFSWHHVNFIHDLISKKQIDMIQVEFMESLPWVYHLPADIKKVFVHHELGFIRKERLLANYDLSVKEVHKLKAAKKRELDALEKYDAIITVTDVDRDILLREGITRPIYSSNLAVNTKSYPYSVKEKELTFIGGYGHQPNKEGIDWFISKVSPMLKARNFTLNLIGTHWPVSYNVSKNVVVSLKGFVEDLSDVALGSIMIVPILSGSGMRMKILEAAAMSLPIVTTTVGVEGLDFINGESCIIADTPEEFANAIIQLEEDAEKRKKIGESANKVFKSKYSPKVLSDKRNDIYKQIVEQKF